MHERELLSLKWAPEQEFRVAGFPTAQPAHLLKIWAAGQAGQLENWQL